MTRLAKIILPVLLALSGFLPAQAQTTIPLMMSSGQRETQPDVSAISRIRFLTSTDFYPFNFIDDTGRLNGFHIDLVRAICEVLELGERCEIQALPFDELEKALLEGQGEAIIAGVAIDEKSRDRLAFTRSYLLFPARFLTRKDKLLAEPIYNAVKKKRVGVIAGSAHEEMLREQFSDAIPVVFEDMEKLLEALPTEDLDAAFGDGMHFSNWLARDEDASCCEFSGGPYISQVYFGEGMAIAVRKDQVRLQQALNYALQKVSDNGRLSEYYLRYFPVGFF